MDNKFLSGLSNFWCAVYKEAAEQIEASLKAQNQTFVNLYHQVLNRNNIFNLEKTPLYKEDFWHVITLKEEESAFVDLNLNIVDEAIAAYKRFKINVPYSAIPYLQDKINSPNNKLVGKPRTEFLAKIPSGFLIPNRKYVNRHSHPIIHNGKTIQPNQEFFAENTNYTTTPGSKGGVYNYGHYFIDLKAEVTGANDFGFITECNIYFPKSLDIFDIFKNNLKYDSFGKKTVTIYAPKVYIETFELWLLFGCIVDVFSTSSEKYRNFLKGLFKIYTKGPTIGNLNEALNTAFGLPVSKEDDVIIEVQVENNFYVLETYKQYSYKIPRIKVFTWDNNLNVTSYYAPVLKLNKTTHTNYIGNTVYNGDYTSERIIPGTSYNVWFPVKKGDGFITDIELIDYINKPSWWLDKNLDDLVLSGLGSDALIEEIKQNVEVFNYLFENYWKFHTLSLSLNYVNLRFGTAFRDVFRILMDVKPTFKTFILSKLEIQALSYQGENEITYVGLLEDNPLALLPSDTEQPIDIQQLLQNIQVPAELQLISEQATLNYFNVVTTHHSLLNLLLGMDMLGMCGVDETILSNPKIGVALENVDLFYEIAKFHVELKDFVSEHDLGLGNEIDVGQLDNQENVQLLGQAGFGGIIENVTFTLFITAPILNIVINITEYTADISWTDISADSYTIQISTNPDFTTYDEYTTTNNYYSFSNLNDATLYYVRVKGVFTSSESDWSNVESFVTDDYLFLYNMAEHSGNTLEDSSTTPYNPGYIYPITDSFTIFDFEMDEGSGSVLEDTTSNNNDGNINSNPPTIVNTTIFNYNMNEGSGSVLEDTTSNNNDGNINSNPPTIVNTTIFNYNMNEGSGSVLEDTTSNNNDGNINSNPPTIVNTTIFNYNMNEGSGSVLEDTTSNNNDGIIGDI